MTATQILEFVRRRFWLIVAGAVIAGGLAAVLSLVWPPVYEAQALLLITKLRPDVTLDPRFGTVAEESVVNLSVQEEQVRRQTLVALAQSADLVQQVIDRLGEDLAPEKRSVSSLAGMVAIGTEGNLVTVEARARDAGAAAAVANAWAGVYQENVNRLYSATAPNSAQIQSELESAQTRYAAAKTALETFLQQSDENELVRQIEQKQQILSDLQDAHLMAAREGAEALLSRLNRLDRLVLNAQGLRQQLAGASGGGPLSPGEQFALLMVEGGAFVEVGENDSLPTTLELGQGWSAEATLTRAQALEHLDRLVETLGAAGASTQAELSDLSSSLLGVQDLLTNGSDESTAALIDTLQDTINELQAKLEQQQTTRQDLSDARDVAQENHLTLVRKAAEVEILSRLTSVEVQVAAVAQLPEEPAFPRPVPTTALGIVAGLLAGLALALVLEHWPHDARASRRT